VADAPPAPVAAGARLPSRADLAVLAVVVALGLVHLAFPFTGDQALFTVGARQIRHGAVLYRDFWDVKQPGVYLFYLAGGSLFAFREVGIHLLELLSLLGFAVVLQMTLRGRFRAPLVASVVPLLVIGAYYAGARALDLTQVEVLASFPMYLALWWVSRAAADDGASRWRLLFLSGVMGGVATLFKLTYLPVALAMWLVVLRVAARARGGHDRSGFLRDLAAVGLGVLVPVGVAVVYFAAYGLLGEVSWTYFVYTPHTTGIAGRPLSRLVHGVVREGALLAVPLALALVGATAVLKRRTDPFVAGLGAWIVVGIPVFLVQHWWSYQLLAFLPPVGVLAGLGLDEIWARRQRLGARVAAAIVVAALVAALPLAAIFGRKVVTLARDDFALTAAGRTRLHDHYEPHYRSARAWRALLDEPGAPGGDVYVLGDPVALYVSGRDQAIATNGWGAEQYDAKVWHRVARQLGAARPVELLVDGFSDRKMRAHSPATRREIRRLYCRVGGSHDEVWYRLRSDLACEGR